MRLSSRHGRQCSVGLLLFFTSFLLTDCWNSQLEAGSLSHLQKAINDEFAWDSPQSWSKALRTDNPRLYLHRIIQTRSQSPSSTPSSPPNFASQAAAGQQSLPLTIFTAASLSRLPQLRQQCRSWPGQLVAALWVPFILGDRTAQSTSGQPHRSSHLPRTFFNQTSTASQSQSVFEGINLHQHQGNDTQNERKEGKELLSTGLQQQDGGATGNASATDRGSYTSAAFGAQSRPQWVSHQPEAIQALLGKEVKISRWLKTLSLTGHDGTNPHLPWPVPMEANQSNGENQLLYMQPLEKSNDFKGCCQLTLLLFAQAFDEELSSTYLFPINVLRNYAALMATTPLISMLDVDLVINAGFSTRMASDPSWTQQLIERAASGSLLIPPAMEAKKCRDPACRDGVEEGWAASQGGKELVETMYRNGSLDTFHCKRGTHYVVDFRHWFESNSSYEIQFALMSEPWFIGHRSILPFYDVRLKGFGFNKQLQVAYAVGPMKMRLEVLPEAWLIHLPHSYTMGAQVFGVGGHTRPRRRTRRPRFRLGRGEGWRVEGPPGSGKEMKQGGQRRRDLREETRWWEGGGSEGGKSQMAGERRLLEVQHVKQGGAKSLPPMDSRAATLAREFFVYTWNMGKLGMESCPLPPHYSPVLTSELPGLLASLPWWLEHQERWDSPQPGPNDLTVDPPRLPAYPKDAREEVRKKLQFCTRLPDV